jgi:ABC-type sugar transport system ATPase subunit
MASVELKNLSKSFGEVEVLHQLNLTVEEGEFVAPEQIHVFAK